MDKLTKILLTIALLFIFSGLIIEQIEIQNLKPQQTPTSPPSTANQTSTPKTSPTSTPISTEVPAATVTEEINAIPNRELPNTPSNSGNYLLITGTVTNNSTNTAYNVGLRVYSYGSAFGGYPVTLIDITVPIASGTYYSSENNLTLSTLSSHETIQVVIMIYPTEYQGQTPTLQGNNVTVVWSNMP